MAETLMYFNLTAELFLGTFFCEGAFLYDFDCFDLFGFFGDELVAAGEPSFAEEITLNIALDIIFIEISFLNEQQILMSWVKKEVTIGLSGHAAQH